MKTYEHLTKTLVIVDDDNVSLSFNEAILRSHCKISNIKTFTDPSEAFRYVIVHSDSICGIITDAYMYRDDCRISTGMQLIQEIKTTIDFDLPILFCTSLSGDVEKTIMLSVGDFVNKLLFMHGEEDKLELYRFLNRLK